MNYNSSTISQLTQFQAPFNLKALNNGGREQEGNNFYRDLQDDAYSIHYLYRMLLCLIWKCVAEDLAKHWADMVL